MFSRANAICWQVRTRLATYRMPRHSNAIRRPQQDSDHTLLWQCPRPEDLVT